MHDKNSAAAATIADRDMTFSTGRNLIFTDFLASLLALFFLWLYDRICVLLVSNVKREASLQVKNEIKCSFEAGSYFSKDRRLGAVGQTNTIKK